MIVESQPSRVLAEVMIMKADKSQTQRKVNCHSESLDQQLARAVGAESTLV